VKWLFYGGAALVVLVVLLIVAGTFLPREHRATARATFRASADTLFARIADVEAYPRWRADVKAVRRLDATDGRAAFVEETSQGEVRYAVEASEPPRRRVTRIADEELPYGGTWTFALEPVDGGTRVAITEDGFVEPPLFRVLARFFFDPHMTMERFLADLGKELGERVSVERVTY